jgi:hypothetical protein
MIRVLSVSNFRGLGVQKESYYKLAPPNITWQYKVSMLLQSVSLSWETINAQDLRKTNLEYDEELFVRLQ